MWLWQQWVNHFPSTKLAQYVCHLLLNRYTAVHGAQSIYSWYNICAYREYQLHGHCVRTHTVRQNLLVFSTYTNCPCWHNGEICGFQLSSEQTNNTSLTPHSLDQETDRHCQLGRCQSQLTRNEAATQSVGRFVVNDVIICCLSRHSIPTCD